MKRISPLRDKEKLFAALDGASSQVDALRRIGLQPSGGNFAALKRAVQEFGFEIPKPDPFIYNKSKIRIQDSLVFKENSKFLKRSSIKKRMFELGFKNECSVCGQGPEWNGKPLTLQLDHINGVYNDNRLENLRIICGHCHSQTDNFAGRNTKRVKNFKLCKDCQGPVTRDSIRCWACNVKRPRYKIDYPPIETLAGMVTKFGYNETGQRLGISGNSVMRYLKKHNVSVQSPFGYDRMNRK